jgi:hypothetical protein
LGPGPSPLSHRLRAGPASTCSSLSPFSSPVHSRIAGSQSSLPFDAGRMRSLALQLRVEHNTTPWPPVSSPTELPCAHRQPRRAQEMRRPRALRRACATPKTPRTRRSPSRPTLRRGSRAPAALHPQHAPDIRAVEPTHAELPRTRPFLPSRVMELSLRPLLSPHVHPPLKSTPLMTMKHPRRPLLSLPISIKPQPSSLLLPAQPRSLFSRLPRSRSVVRLSSPP